MSRLGPVKHFIFAFLIAIVFYLVTFKLIEHRRTQSGPWSVEFSAEISLPPTLKINQPQLGLTNITLVFTGVATAPTNASLRFTRPQDVPYPVPFGNCVFQDILFQPGTVVFEIFGHEIQLLPRVLTIDKVEHIWRSGETISLPPVAVNKANISPAVP